jgi:hypothetical protein
MSSNQSPPNPPLVERDFPMEQDGAVYRITAKAAYFEPALQDQPYTLIFTCGETHIEMSQPDKRRYSREEAQVVAEQLFASGSIERYIKQNLKGWIFVSNLRPESFKR